MSREAQASIPLRVHALLDWSGANGPGERTVIWLQGCTLGCPGCWNPASHSRADGFERSVEDTLAWLEAARSRAAIAGLTISGGEPMEQAPGLVELVEGTSRRFQSFSIGLFSGYGEGELDRGRYRCFPEREPLEKRELWRRIRRTLDFAVLGRYNARAPSSDPLVTSKNQRLQLYSDRHSPADFGPQLVEVIINTQGLSQVTGFPVNGSATE